MKYFKTILSLTIFLLYLIFVIPYYLRITNLDTFQKTELRKRVTEISQAFFEKTNQCNLVEKYKTDFSLISNLERVIGIKSTEKLIEENFSTIFYKVDFEEKERPSFFKSTESLKVPFSIIIDAKKRVFYLKSPYKRGGISNTEEAKNILLKLGITFENLSETSLEELEKNNFSMVEKFSKDEDENLPNLKGKLSFSEKIDGLPLSIYLHSISFYNDYFVYERKIFVKSGIVNDSLWGTTRNFFFYFVWLIILTFSIGVTFNKIRKDEIDWSLFLTLTFFCTLLTFISNFSVDFSSFNFLFIFFLIIYSPLVGCIIAFIITLAESKTREVNPDTLKTLKPILSFKLNVRDVSRIYLRAFINGNFYFLAPLLIFLSGRDIERGFLLIPPEIFDDEKLSFIPFIFKNFIKSAIFPIFSILLFGVFAPSLLKSNSTLGKISFVIFLAFFFSSYSPHSPFVLVFIAFLIFSFFIFEIYEKYGFIGTTITLWLPFVLERSLLTFLAKEALIAIQGLISLLTLLLLLIVALYFSFKGINISEIKPYEPAYLKRIKEKERFERELELAKNLHQKLLPKEFPQIDGFEISAYCEPALSVGGDYYDFFEYKDKIYIFLGDVSGKGIKASFYMTLVKGLLHALYNVIEDPYELLSVLNEKLKNIAEEGVFLTLVLIVLNKRKKEIEIFSAGHNPPLLLKNNEIFEIKERGFVIGLMEKEVFKSSLKSSVFKMEKDDVLLLYTDGVTEAMNPSFEEYGVERLKKTLLSVASLPVMEIISEIRKSIFDFTSNLDLSDDLTLVVLKAK